MATAQFHKKAYNRVWGSVTNPPPLSELCIGAPTSPPPPRGGLPYRAQTLHAPYASSPHRSQQKRTDAQHSSYF
jgi:hypothetical protein